MYYGVLYTLHRKLQQVGVCGIGEVDIYLPVLCAVESFELVCEIFGGGLAVIGGSGIIREVVADGLFSYFLFEKVGFVKEKDDGGALEPSQAHYRLKEKQCFLHLILRNSAKSVYILSRIDASEVVTYGGFVFH